MPPPWGEGFGIQNRSPDPLVRRAGRDHPFPISAGSPWRGKGTSHVGWDTGDLPTREKNYGHRSHPAHVSPNGRGLNSRLNLKIGNLSGTAREPGAVEIDISTSRGGWFIQSKQEDEEEGRKRLNWLSVLVLVFEGCDQGRKLRVLLFCPRPFVLRVALCTTC